MVQPFRTIHGIAAPLPEKNIDTDAIIPAQFLRSPSFDLGQGLLYHKRFAEDGTARPDFVLNMPRYRACSMLVAGDNFGCGSSREHAVWALQAYGIKCVISTSFGEIFFDNCFTNGVLAVTLPQDKWQALADYAEGSNAPISIGLTPCRIHNDAISMDFVLDSKKRDFLLEGLDAISTTMKHEGDIRSFRERDRQDRPWIYAGTGSPA